MQRPSLPDFVLQVRHHHSIALPDGRVIDGDKSLAIMQEQYQQTFGPLSLSGKSVVDFGTWSGAFAVEAVQRGAGKVVGVDQVVWKDANQREVFKFVTKSFGYDIPDIECDLDASPLDISPLGEFDISLFLAYSTILKVLLLQSAKSQNSHGRHWWSRPTLRISRPLLRRPWCSLRRWWSPGRPTGRSCHGDRAGVMPPRPPCR